MKLKLTLLSLIFSTYLLGYQAKDFSGLLEKKVPGFSHELLEMHLTLYKGYVKNTNGLVEALKQDDMGSINYMALKRRFGWEYDGMRLHELYFENLGGSGKLRKRSPLHRAIERDFGSYAKWEANFKGIGMMRGVGWVILYKEPIEGKLVNVWVEEHDIGLLAGGEPLLVMDVWEHAYITEYGLKRKSYIDAFFQVIDFESVSLRFEHAKQKKTYHP
ncbi:MAG: Superoxide dismutase [Fe] [Chlamydiia bacterium]|nr:Superoxide dismutase [Fe] [Chlamydiia bacterium]MCH9615752.1 Superoxide dismutase [Fe] [Chlamydiia bacterium]MCH9628845.1 Superoxide dismutase [Fe] [Chlamydiia bacterium]